MFLDGVEPSKMDLGKVSNGGYLYCSLTMGSKEDLRNNWFTDGISSAMEMLIQNLT